ncbi:HlyC/CorC family transporter [Luteithermobacter gelatinilyticus]|uniref:HlyC/CorC family transporter n=1 Tax=Luteithermobacter gelatinilyticus TaxID=2582913 RepID=UPI00110575EF|nr:HlyC/CorC family transporter [Luteithermobacter gelatinilyticus]
MEADLIFSALSILFLILLSGFFSGSETSLTAASRANIHKLAKEGHHRAALVERLKDDAESLIGAILLGNNLVNILASALATSLFIQFFGEVGVVYATAAMTILVLVFAEVLPKTYAITNADKMALAVSPLIRMVVVVFSPVVKTVQIIVRGTLKLFGVDTRGQQRVLSPQDEIRGAISLQAHEGGLVKEHKDMLSSILDLEEVLLEDVMVHRKNVEMINADDSMEDILQQIVDSTHTRLPLWKDNPDNVIGVIHAKDVLRAIKAKNGDLSRLTLEEITQDPWFVPETTSLQEQLGAFLDRKTHFALVVDEYGALMGITTLEDILEEIVGEISDEYDIHQTGVRVLKNGTVIAEGTTAIRDLNRQFNWTLSDEEATTIAGFVIALAEAIPLPGQSFHKNGFTFEVLKRRRNQITSIRILPPQKVTRRDRVSTGAQRETSPP